MARKVLSGNTVGYRKHPQLLRFTRCDDPLAAIDCYLHSICDEAASRGYNFDRAKLDPVKKTPTLEVTNGQMDYERRHLLSKLEKRDIVKFGQLSSRKPQKVLPHPIFFVVDGPVEKWEIVK